MRCDPGNGAGSRRALPFAGITRIRFIGSAGLPLRPLSLRVDHPIRAGWLPVLAEARREAGERQGACRAKQGGYGRRVGLRAGGGGGRSSMVSHATTAGPKQISRPIGMAKMLQNWSELISGGECARGSAEVKPAPSAFPGCWQREVRELRVGTHPVRLGSAHGPQTWRGERARDPRWGVQRPGSAAASPHHKRPVHGGE